MASRTPFTVLGCLSLQPMSGYDIKRFLDRTVVHFWSESYGQLYPALRELETQRLIVGEDAPGQRGRDKRIYRITESGRNRLRDWLSQPAEPVRPRYEHSLKLFFGFNVPPSVSLQHVIRIREESTTALEAFRRTEEELARWAEREPVSIAPYWLIVLRGGIRYSEMALEWCDESEAMLRSLPESATETAPAGTRRPDRQRSRRADPEPSEEKR